MADTLMTVTEFKKLLKEPKRHAIGKGLYLEVADSGAASWVVRKQVAGRRRELGLGSYPDISLATARDDAAKASAMLAAGVDPVAERKKADGIPTFRKAAALVHAGQVKNWQHGKHVHQWLRSLETYAFPKIGDMTVDRIDRRELLDVLSPIWIEKPETARRVRQRMGAVLDWAFVKGYRETEAPLRALSKALPKVMAARGHFEAMPYADVPGFVARLRQRDGMGALALEAAILTAARSGEVRGATWDEIDLDAGLWSIPGARMKSAKPHVVPLSPAAIAVFRRALALRTEGGGPLVFPGQAQGKKAVTGVGKPISDMTLGAVLKRMGESADPHGFRSSFKDWCGEVAGFANELSEAALAHAIPNKAEAAYRRGSMLDRRRVMMDAWADYCGGGTGAALKLVAA
jgi:integrase